MKLIKKATQIQKMTKILVNHKRVASIIMIPKIYNKKNNKIKQRKTKKLN